MLLIRTCKFLTFNKIACIALKSRTFSPKNTNICRLTANLCENVRSIHVNQHLRASQDDKNIVLVYEGPLKQRIKYVKMLSLSSSMLGFALLPVVLKDLIYTNVLLACLIGVVSSGFLSTPLLLHWITKRYVIELNFDAKTETFSAKTYNIVSQVMETKFKANDVKVPELPGMLTSFIVKDSPLFVDANLVKDPDAYSIMMGYDKPFDFKLESERQKENT